LYKDVLIGKKYRQVFQP